MGLPPRRPRAGVRLTRRSGSSPHSFILRRRVVRERPLKVTIAAEPPDPRARTAHVEEQPPGGELARLLETRGRESSQFGESRSPSPPRSSAGGPAPSARSVTAWEGSMRHVRITNRALSAPLCSLSSSRRLSRHPVPESLWEARSSPFCDAGPRIRCVAPTLTRDARTGGAVRVGRS
jgi:hypothetical protein